ncbi:MAG: KEOPS complex subunit Cgi121 [Candidatus Thermoplasmatota archaeon]
MIIIGAKGKMDVGATIKKFVEFCEKNSLIGQIFDADLVFGEEHLAVAYEHAKRAFEKGKNICKKIEMEMLLYASGKRQINEAISLIGAKKEGNYAFFVCGKIEREKVADFISSLNLEIDQDVIDFKKEKLKKFGINEKEIFATDEKYHKDLIFEKIALLDAIK